MKKIYGISDKIEAYLIETAKQYNDNEFFRFEAEIGWEDWMEEFTEAPVGEPITDSDFESIESILQEAFTIAHN